MKKICILTIINEVSFTNEVNDFFKESNDIEIKYNALNGPNGIELLQKHEKDLDLIILDTKIIKDTITFLTILEKLNINKKVIIITNNSEYLEEITKFNIQGIFLKPLSLEVLEERIKKLFQNTESKIVNLEVNNIERKITTLLHDLGMPSNILGYHYIRDAIFLIIEKPSLLDSITKELYPKVALNHKSTKSRVERSMRNAIEISFTRGNLEKIEEIFRYTLDSNKAKPTNSEFISILAEKIKSEMETELLQF